MGLSDFLMAFPKAAFPMVTFPELKAGAGFSGLTTGVLVLSAAALSACAATPPVSNALAAPAAPAAISSNDHQSVIETVPTADDASVVPAATAPLPPARPAAPAIADQPPHEPDLAKQAEFAEAMQQVADRQKVFDSALERVRLTGNFAQGGVVFGQTEPGAAITLDGEPVMVGEDGRFVMGFGRDSALSALLVATLPDGAIERRGLEIEDRTFKVERINGVDQSKVSGFTPTQLEKIGADRKLKDAARASTDDNANWAGGFDWPVIGRISGLFGSQRILNNEPKRPHSGVDVAVPTGTPVRAPASGIVTLAESDMYFEGGLILLDHGHWLESAFLHLSRIDVAPGQKVNKGDIIGAVGATGRVTGPHLHWSMKWKGRLVDAKLAAGEMPPEAPSAVATETADD